MPCAVIPYLRQHLQVDFDENVYISRFWLHSCHSAGNMVFGLNHEPTSSSATSLTSAAFIFALLRAFVVINDLSAANRVGVDASLVLEYYTAP